MFLYFKNWPKWLILTSLLPFLVSPTRVGHFYHWQTGTCFWWIWMSHLSPRFCAGCCEVQVDIAVNSCIQRAPHVALNTVSLWIGAEMGRVSVLSALSFTTPFYLCSRNTEVLINNSEDCAASSFCAVDSVRVTSFSCKRLYPTCFQCLPHLWSILEVKEMPDLSSLPSLHSKPAWATAPSRCRLTPSEPEKANAGMWVEPPITTCSWCLIL